MRKQIVTLALVGSLAATGAALVVPGIANAASSTTTAVANGVADRVAHIQKALAGLVTNGTLTQAQADKVATTLAADMPPGGPGRRGHGPLSPEATAKILGITVDQLRAAEQSGKTLAQIAADHGISKPDLIAQLVTAAKAQLAAGVSAGRLTQAQADAVAADLTAHITEHVDRVRPPKGDRGPDGPPPPAATTTTPSA